MKFYYFLPIHSTISSLPPMSTSPTVFPLILLPFSSEQLEGQVSVRRDTSFPTEDKVGRLEHTLQTGNTFERAISPVLVVQNPHEYQVAYLLCMCGEA